MKKILGLASLGTAGAATVLAISLNAAPVAAQEVTLYKNPQCGCCENYADYLRENGFTVEVVPTQIWRKSAGTRVFRTIFRAAIRRFWATT